MNEIELWAGVGEGKYQFVEGNHEGYDIFIAAFNLSERARSLFTRVQAREKFWLIHPEYDFAESEVPTTGHCLRSDSRNEADFIIATIGSLSGDLPQHRVAVDITGMMRPHILFLMHYFEAIGLRNYDVLYTDPQRYKRQADTVFSSNVYEVRQVCGFEGAHNTDMSNDVLVVGSGYDHELVSHVIGAKSSAKLVQLLSLPSLSADMYQESILRLERVVDSPYQTGDDQTAFASANDPFVTCGVLQQTVRRLMEYQPISNLYLSPLATKPQVLGFGLYFQQQHELAASIVFPFAMTYDKETSTGVGKSWVYPVRN